MAIFFVQGAAASSKQLHNVVSMFPHQDQLHAALARCCSVLRANSVSRRHTGTLEIRDVVSRHRNFSCYPPVLSDLQVSGSTCHLLLLCSLFPCLLRTRCHTAPSTDSRCIYILQLSHITFRNYYSAFVSVKQEVRTAGKFDCCCSCRNCHQVARFLLSLFVRCTNVLPTVRLCFFLAEHHIAPFFHSPCVSLLHFFQKKIQRVCAGSPCSRRSSWRTHTVKTTPR